jgi:hypothetical protein
VLATVVGSIVQLVPAIPIEHIKTKLQVRPRRRLQAGHMFVSRCSEKAAHIISGNPRPSMTCVSIAALCTAPLTSSENMALPDSTRSELQLAHLKTIPFQGGAAMFWRDLIGFLFYIPVYEILYRHLHRRGTNETIAQVFNHIDFRCSSPGDIRRHCGQCLLVQHLPFRGGEKSNADSRGES